MSDTNAPQAAAREHAFSIPIDEVNVTDTRLWSSDTVLPYFERLRRDDPVHLHPAGQHPEGPFWSVTRYDDIVAVDTNHEAFSSEPAITLEDPMADFSLPMFIAMDPPKHDVQRRTVSPIASPGNIRNLEPLIRQRIQNTLDSLPIGEPFNWVDLVSIELTAQMLATLFDIPFEDRRKLTYWSDAATADPASGFFGDADFETAVVTALQECGEYFGALWAERQQGEAGNDLISMLAHGEATRAMPPHELLGNIILLIVGGNDTTRNTMSGSVLALDRNPDERRKIETDRSLIPSMVSETIRWQTPLAYMRRTAKQDVELGGKLIREGDKVAMWYLSGNRDGSAIEQPDRYWVDRPNVRRHLSFGFGLHRCVGNRLAELQLRILWEEILVRFPAIHVQGEPTRVPNFFTRGYSDLTVVIPERL